MAADDPLADFAVEVPGYGRARLVHDPSENGTTEG